MGSENQADDDTTQHAEHLADVDDGCGCTEIWERLADIRTSD
ncbi:hypothetical protein ATJ93_1064 [Halopiger aswanensis]|uniref:Uncharacterized protein n=1 Tax=Halopiger aswanensis TaxID=148449 RepID=A0A419WRL4_9EURY|nr:hypothetical protein ATJ93_1064 [Halopiger aswanensis]